MVDSAMFYLIGTLYPLVARATYGALSFPQYPGEVGSSDADADAKAAAQQAAEAAIAEPLDVYRAFFLDGKQFIGGAAPSIADIRLAATLEFLRAIDYAFPVWAEEYMAAMETALGDGVLGAGGRRARLHRLREVAERLNAPGRGEGKEAAFGCPRETPPRRTRLYAANRHAWRSPASSARNPIVEPF